MRDTIAELTGRFLGARFIADYTGGTKTMTVALVYTPLEQGVELQHVAGARPNLVRMEHGADQTRSRVPAGSYTAVKHTCVIRKRTRWP